LGVQDDESAVALIKNISGKNAFFDSDGNLLAPCMWVAVDNIPAQPTTVRFFPSIKPHAIGRRPNIDSLSNYDLNSAFVAAQTGPSGTFSASINGVALRSYLSSLSITASDAIHRDGIQHDLSGPELARYRTVQAAIAGPLAPSRTVYPRGCGFG